MNSSFSWKSVLLLVDRRGGLGIRLCLRGTIRGVLWFSASREVVKFIEAPTKNNLLACIGSTDLIAEVPTLLWKPRSAKLT